MRIMIKKIIIVLSMGVLAINSYGFDKVGTTSAQFLQIGAGGRLTGMGGAGVALVEGSDGMFWNPAGIGLNQGITVSAYYANWFADMRHQFFGAALPIGENSTVGVFALSLGGSEFEQTTLSFQEGNGVMVEYGDLALGLSLARRLTDRFLFGGTIKYIHQTLFHETASSFAVDMGTHLDTDLPGFSIGMAMRNLGGAMKLEGRDLLTSGPEETAQEYQMSEWPLPLTFQVGVGWKLIGKGGMRNTDSIHGLTAAVDGVHLNEGLTRWVNGLEYDFRQIIFLRVGKVFGHDTEDLTFGAGLKLPLGAYSFIFDFAYADMGDLGGVERFCIGIR